MGGAQDLCLPIFSGRGRRRSDPKKWAARDRKAVFAIISRFLLDRNFRNHYPANVHELKDSCVLRMDFVPYS